MKQEIPSYFKEFDNYIREKYKNLSEFEIVLLEIGITVNMLERTYRALYLDKEKS